MGQRGLINSLLSRTRLHNAARALRRANTGIKEGAPITQRFIFAFLTLYHPPPKHPEAGEGEDMQFKQYRRGLVLAVILLCRMTVYLRHSSSGDKFLSPVSVRASEYTGGSVHVHVGCVGRIICLALLSSPVCLRGAVCLLGAARPPERLLQHNHFKPEPVLFILTNPGR